MFRQIFTLSIVLTLLFLSGCAGSATPQLIASYPGGKAPAWQPPQQIPSGQVIYYGDMRLSVSDVDWAAGRAIDLASQYGGYPASSTSWSQDGREIQYLTLAVPTSNFNALHQELLELGSLESESFSGDLVYTTPGGWTSYSQIRLQLEEKAFPRVSLPSIRWRPLRTLSNAFDVSLSILGFLTDVLIWIVVVLGPFVLIGWGLWALIRRARRHS